MTFNQNVFIVVRLKGSILIVKLIVASQCKLRFFDIVYGNWELPADVVID